MTLLHVAWILDAVLLARSWVYLVNVTDHYVVVQGRKIADNNTGKPVWLKEYPHRRARVWKTWRIVKK